MKSFKHLKLILLSLVAGIIFASSYAPSTNAALFDSAKQDACAGANLQTSSSGNCGDDAASSLTKNIKTFINLFSIIIGIIAVIMIIVAGLRFVTSAGDSNGISSAKNTLIYAIVGLIITAFAQIIVKFVLDKAVK